MLVFSWDLLRYFVTCSFLNIKSEFHNQLLIFPNFRLLSSVFAPSWTTAEASTVFTTTKRLSTHLPSAF
jgi:hypothetical protein